MVSLKRHFTLLILCFLLPLMVTANTLTRKNFTIHYENKDRKTAKFIADRAEIYENEIRYKLGLNMTPYQINLTVDEKEFRAFSGEDFPHWGVAAAQYSGRRILLKSPRFSRQSFPELSQTLYHEMIHIALEPINRKGYFPRWLNEGLAQHEAEQFHWKQKVLLGQAALYGKFIDLYKIDDVLKFNQNRANLAYAQSVSAVQYLIYEHGYHSMGRLLVLMSEGVAWEEAFEIVYAYPPKYYGTNWEMWAKKHYKAYALVDIHYLLWVFLPLLVLFAWLRLRRKNNLIYKKWQIEETMENPESPLHHEKKSVNSYDA
jgi:hypothetical protein